MLSKISDLVRNMRNIYTSEHRVINMNIYHIHTHTSYRNTFNIKWTVINTLKEWSGMGHQGKYETSALDMGRGGLYQLSGYQLLPPQQTCEIVCVSNCSGLGKYQAIIKQAQSKCLKEWLPECMNDWKVRMLPGIGNETWCKCLYYCRAAGNMK